MTTKDTQQRTHEVVQVPIDELRPDPANPRRISDAQLEALTKSLREYGFVQPVLARREDKTVIGGHQRLTAARRLGYKTVPVIYLDITLEQARLLNLSLNKISGDWDNELLSRLLAGLAPMDGLDLSLSGFSDDELKKLLKGVESREKRDRLESFDLDAALEAARAAPRAQRGELWALGDHRLLVGDACDTADVSRLFGDARAAMAFNDPPYNVSLGDHGGQQRGQTRRRLENDSLSPVEWEAFVPPLGPQPPAVHGRRHLHLHVHQGVAAGLTACSPRKAGTGATRSSGPRTASSWDGPTTSGSTSRSGTAGAKVSSTTGTATATRATSGGSSGRRSRKLHPTRSLCL